MLCGQIQADQVTLLSFPFLSVAAHLVNESARAMEDLLRRVFVAPIAQPQIHPGDIKLSDNLLLYVIGVRSVKA